MINDLHKSIIIATFVMFPKGGGQETTIIKLTFKIYYYVTYFK